jgi:EmrB/QacA subfamily drug resistance transporter
MTGERANHKWWTLFAMCFALFMIMLDNTIVNVALPSIQRALNASPQSLEWTINAYVLTFAALILLGGKLGDRFGRKRIFLVGLGVFTAASAACALAQTDGQLIAARTVQGVGGAMLNPLSLSILVSAFPRRELPTAIGIWAGISGLGIAIGPLLGGFLVEHASWSAVFWVNVPVGVIGAAVAAWAVRESRDTTARSLDIVGTVLVTAGLFALTWGFIRTSSHSWGSPQVAGLLAAAAVLLALFLFWESRVSDPMLPLRFFRVPAFAVSSIVVLLVGFALFGVVYFITLYFQNVQGYSPLGAGLRSLPVTMMIMLVGPGAGKLNARLGPRVVMGVGMLFAGAGLVGLSRIGVDSSYNTIWPFQVLMGTGMAMTMPAVSSTGMSAVEPQKAGIASGVINASRQVGGAMGIAVLGSIATTLAANSWGDRIAGLGPARHALAEHLTPLVQGGRGAVIGRLAGPQAQSAAMDSFVHGVRGALLAGGLLMLTASLVAWIGLRGMRPPRREPGEGEPGAAIEPVPELERV